MGDPPRGTLTTSADRLDEPVRPSASAALLGSRQLFKNPRDLELDCRLAVEPDGGAGDPSKPSLVSGETSHVQPSGLVVRRPGYELFVAPMPRSAWSQGLRAEFAGLAGAKPGDSDFRRNPQEHHEFEEGYQGIAPATERTGQHPRTVLSKGFLQLCEPSLPRSRLLIRWIGWQPVEVVGVKEGCMYPCGERTTKCSGTGTRCAEDENSHRGGDTSERLPNVWPLSCGRH